MENVLTVLFDVESEGYQAITSLRNKPAVEDAYAIMQANLVKREGNNLIVLDGFDSGVNTVDHTLAGGLIGSLVGILGGPLGVLFLGTSGAMMGSAIDMSDAVDNSSLLEIAATKLGDQQVALLALAEEDTEEALNAQFQPYKCTVIRFDAPVLAREIDEASKIGAEMQRQAIEKLREEKEAESMQKAVDAAREDISEAFEVFKKNMFK